jgi:glutamate carboxypeptidase
MSPAATDALRHFEGRLPHIIEVIERLVNVESPSTDIPALNTMANVLEECLTEICGPCEVEWFRGGEEQRPHLLVRLGERTDVLLIGHFDTVHPVGTLEEHPFKIDGDRLHGPGALDMKGGVVLMMEVARYILEHNTRPNLTLFFNSDEEIGSVTSNERLVEIAEGGKIALAFESTLHQGLLKTGARGVRRFKLTATGRGGHAAYPEHNVNPVDALADVILTARKLSNPPNGIVVTPTIVQGAEMANVVPGTASIYLECRGDSEQKLEDVERAIYRIRATDERVTITAERFIYMHTFEKRDENKAFAYAKAASESLGYEEPIGVEARGAGDVNYVSIAIPDALEGLGGWGDGLHDPLREHLMISSLIPSAALSAIMTQSCLDDHR